MLVRKIVLSLAAIAVLSPFPTVAYADGDEDSTPKPTRVLEGGVRGTVLLFDDGCARITLARELIQESTAKIMKEATRKDTVVMRGPNVIGNGMVIPSLGGAGGVMQMGELPIRKDRLDRFITETEQNIAALQSYVDALQIPAEKAPSLDPVYVSMRDTMQEAQDHLTKLKDLSSAKRLVNGKIGKEALRIYDAMGQLEKQRSQLLKLANALGTDAAQNSAPQSAPAEDKPAEASTK